MYVITILGQTYNLVHTIDIRPLRFVCSIRIVVITVVGRSIVNGITCLKRKSFQYHREVNIYAHVKLILTAGVGIDTSCIKVSYFIGLIYLCTSQQIFTINQVTTIINQIPCIGIVLHHIINGD